jgi:hypothetical protein
MTTEQTGNTHSDSKPEPDVPPQNATKQKVLTPIKQAWRDADALYELARDAPAQYRGQFTRALFGERAELGGRCLVEATARRIVHRLLRTPHVKRDSRKGRVPE